MSRDATESRYLPPMSVTSVAPEQLRPELHQRIDRMDAEQLELLRHILLKLELDQVVAKLHETFDAARCAGKLSRVDEVIREVRAGYPYA